jgi:hypothetical protein
MTRENRVDKKYPAPADLNKMKMKAKSAMAHFIILYSDVIKFSQICLG